MRILGGIVGLVFTAVVVLVIPLLAVRTLRLLEEGLPFPPRPVFLGRTIVLQLVLAALAVLTARFEEVRLVSMPRSPALAAVLALCGSLAGLGLIPLAWRYATEAERRRADLIVPRTRVEYRLWGVLSATAGIGEEIVYRGVLFVLLWRWSGSVPAAALLAAAAFGLAHSVQGPKAVAATGAIGLLLQVLVIATGSLFPAMAVHAIHDAAAGVWYRRLADRDLPPEDAVLPAS